MQAYIYVPGIYHKPSLFERACATTQINIKSHVCPIQKKNETDLRSFRDHSVTLAWEWFLTAHYRLQCHRKLDNRSNKKQLTTRKMIFKNKCKTKAKLWTHFEALKTKLLPTTFCIFFKMSVAKKTWKTRLLKSEKNVKYVFILEHCANHDVCRWNGVDA